MRVKNSTILEELKRIPGLLVHTDVCLADISNWKVGGRAAIIVQPSNVGQIIALRKRLTQQNSPSFIIGNTTNLLFTDEDINAVLVQLGTAFSVAVIEGGFVKAQAGLWVPKLARLALQNGLGGIEHTCGIPGTLGGLVVMNGGSQRKGIGDHVVYVKTIDANGQSKKYTNEACQFAYRRSIFQHLDEMIVEVGLKLDRTASKQEMHAEMLAILRSRSEKFPRKLPNCGSVFVSNPTMYEQYGPPGKVIEACGLKGLQRGKAQISTEHANFIVNNGGATAADILYLINYVRDTVLEKTGYLMKVEAKLVNSAGAILEI